MRVLHKWQGGVWAYNAILNMSSLFNVGERRYAHPQSEWVILFMLL